ncbi:YutD family protein [Globicatella sanguinis]|uniref:YutD family protein n=1 Tax=Globicatella sanguinis TaxID=13076 RepID=UPI00082607D8|nr:YutD family protein [Globicatella sanguinis]MDK7631487.1 YutD family protein [Globicatella sanguinis]WIK66979.1 YutD family protein [Globicatella sanguinis]WKT56384.1 YutD family protein [Globicatella sanguinis]
MSKKSIDTISDQIESILTSIIHDEDVSEKNIHQIDETTIQINEQIYHVATNYREGFDFGAFEARYQEYFERFDFIVGDWGFEQLRLRGFYQINRRKVPREQIIDYLDDYLKEYCNFGCRYFVLAKEEALVKYNQLRERISQAKPQSKRPTKNPINTIHQKQQNSLTTNNEKTKRKSRHKRHNQREQNQAFQIKQLGKQHTSQNKKADFEANKVVKSKQKQTHRTNKRNFIIKQQP